MIQFINNEEPFVGQQEIVVFAFVGLSNQVVGFTGDHSHHVFLFVKADISLDCALINDSCFVISIEVPLEGSVCLCINVKLAACEMENCEESRALEWVVEIWHSNGVTKCSTLIQRRKTRAIAQVE